MKKNVLIEKICIMVKDELVANLGVCNGRQVIINDSEMKDNFKLI